MALSHTTTRRLLGGVTLSAWALFTCTASGRLGSSDAEAMYAVAQSIVDHGGIDVGDCVPHDNHCVPGVDGRNYSGFGILPSIAAVPPVALARIVAPHDTARRGVLAKLAVSMTVGPISGAMLVAAVTLLTLALGYGRRTALGMASIVALASPFWFYSSKGFYSEPLFALLLVGAAVAFARSDRPRNAAIAGVLVGASLFTRLVGIILLPAFAVFARRQQWRRGVAFALSVGAAGALIAWLNYARFGGVTRTGYHLLFPSASAMFGVPWHVGLRGVLLDSTAGVLWFFPAALLAPCAWRSLHRRRPDIAFLSAGAVGLQLLFFMKYTVWTGGWSIGPRMLLPVLPLLALPLVEWLEQPTRARRTMLALTLGWSCAMQVLWVMPPHFRMFTVREWHRATGVSETPLDRSAIRYAIATAPRVLRYAAGVRTLDADEQYLNTKANAVNQLAPDVWWIKAIVLGQSAMKMIVVALILLTLAMAGAVLAWRAAAGEPRSARTAPPTASA